MIIAPQFTLFTKRLHRSTGTKDGTFDNTIWNYTDEQTI